ncbi:DUF3872 domain-containing protein [Flavobacterium sp. MR2016-29]|uniref:DUF3872 domain-containing protein n=1 Tax=Flavobacterium sp. MR2016-29 TaxID=2783795 RepID=UPI00188C1238|nr:DUF3872 domain-containing protein [Flavobacterium sp. MR2016-29]MBF4491521.1 DUF3872 domain-containing protein [Flavobacterium sp. MR2016-29]
MKAILNRFKKVILPVLMCFFTLLSCDTDELEIKHDFPFELKVMPVPEEIANHSTVEIRISIERPESYSGAAYFIRYFQFDGKGTLQYYDEQPYLPNDLYPLKAKEFRLLYTSQSVVSQSFEVWISDNFGNEKQLSFQFNSAD